MLTERQMSTTPELPKELPGDEPDDVLFNSIYGLRSIELNRPKKLNSLNGSMARKILPRLKVSKKGDPRAFGDRDTRAYHCRLH